MVVIYKELTLRETIIKVCLRYHKFINRAFYQFIQHIELVKNESTISCPNINSLTLIMRVPLNTCFASGLETHSKDIVRYSDFPYSILFNKAYQIFGKKLFLLCRCNFFTPKCSFLMFPLSLRTIFFWLKTALVSRL